MSPAVLFAFASLMLGASPDAGTPQIDLGTALMSGSHAEARGRPGPWAEVDCSSRELTVRGTQIEPEKIRAVFKRFAGHISQCSGTVLSRTVVVDVQVENSGEPRAIVLSKPTDETFDA